MNVTELKTRFHLDNLLNPALQIDDGSDVIRGLTQKQKTLPPHYFYDERGSLLFEEICELAEYYPTRTETAILQQYATEIAKMTGACELVELGSGSSTKTRILLDAYQALGYPLRYLPIDVSATILESSTISLLEDYPSLQIHGIVGTYELALTHLNPSPLPKRMICFLGSTLGNFSPEECDLFFSQISNSLETGDYFLLGIDLHKSPEILTKAYNDSRGITAQFNLNILEHLNWRFSGNFDINLFKHWAFYNTTKNQIEMHLVCQRSHIVKLEKLGLTIDFLEGETIFTEISRKFNLDKMQQELEYQGLKTLQIWTDINNWFGVIFCQVM
jgi:dimethylhistidine N-methyltransferase